MKETMKTFDEFVERFEKQKEMKDLMLIMDMNKKEVRRRNKEQKILLQMMFKRGVKRL